MCIIYPSAEIVEIQKNLSLKLLNWVVYAMSLPAVQLLLLSQLVLKPNRTLDVGEIYVAYGLYNMMKNLGLLVMPNALLQISEGIVAIKRMQVSLEC